MRQTRPSIPDPKVINATRVLYDAILLDRDKELIVAGMVLGSEVYRLLKEVKRLRKIEEHAIQVVYGTEYLDYEEPWPALENLKKALRAR